MRLRRLGGLALLLLGAGCGGGDLAGNDGRDSIDVPIPYDVFDGSIDAYQPDEGPKFDDTPYVLDDDSAGDDNTYLKDDNVGGDDSVSGPDDAGKPDVPQYDVDGWDVDSPFDIIDAYDFGKDIYNPDEGVNSEDLYQPDEDTTGDSGDVVDPCAPVAKACSDDYRDPITGICEPLELKVDFDGWFMACLDFGDSFYEDSECYPSWESGTTYHLPGHPTGGHATCEKAVKKWLFKSTLYDCNDDVLVIKRAVSHFNQGFAINSSGVLCVGIEDESGEIGWDSIGYTIKKEN